MDYRDPEIREKVSILVEELLELYVTTSPTDSYLSEDDKLENARSAIDIWWHLFDILVFWAQSHLAAYCIGQEDEKLVKLAMQLDSNIAADSHILELLGNNLLAEKPEKSLSLDRLATDIFTQSPSVDFGDVPTILNKQAMRSLLVELMASQSPNSNFWRFEMQRAFKALNQGQIEELFKPTVVNRHGQPFSLNQWKLEAVMQVSYRVGLGIKKFRALEDVANGIGQSPETLRSWEKELGKTEDYSVELICAELAGYYKTDFDNEVDIYIGFPDYGKHRGKNYIEIALELHDLIPTRQLGEIGKRIRMYRERQN